MRTSAEAEHGVTRARLRGAAVQHPFTGVSSIELDLDDVLDLCAAYSPLLRPGEAFSHATAALLFRMPLPPGLGPRPLHVLSPDSYARARTAGVVGHRTAHPFDVRRVLGLPVVAPELAWLQLAGTLDRGDLTAAGDFLITGERVGTAHLEPLTTLEELRRRHRDGLVRRGRRDAAWALDRIRFGADSRPETLLRLLVVEADLPEPVVNPAVDVAPGVTLHPDLAYPQLRIAIEYQGAPHAGETAWKRDTARRELFEDAGWRVFFVTSAELFHGPEEFLGRLRRAITVAAAR